MQPEDIGRLVTATTPRLSPDGSTVVFAVVRVDAELNKARSQLWLVPSDGSGAAEPLTSGATSDAEPAWSPDGRHLAFARRPLGDGASTLVVLPVGRPGEPVVVATSPEAITRPAWSPDGRSLAYVTRVRDARYDEPDPRRQPPRRITRFFSRLDDEGWVVDRPRHVHVTPADGLTPPRDLTPGEFEFDEPAWLADGSGVVAAGKAHDTWDLDLTVDLYVLRLDGTRRALTHHTGSYSHPAPSPDGTRVAFLGYDDPLVWPRNAKVGVLDLATGERAWVSGGLDRTCSPYPGAQAPAWVGDRLVFSVEDRGRVHLYTGPSEPGPDPVLLVGGDRYIGPWDARGGRVAFSASVVDRPAEVFVSAPGGEHRLSTVTEAFVAAARPRPAEHFTVASTGGAEVDAWVLLPERLDTSGGVPALLNIHGGPFTQFGERFFDEAQLQVAAGFVVVLCNPRGSSGREEAWGRAIAGPKSSVDPGAGWGTVDVDDVLAVVDATLARYPFVDASRLGVLGGSYGGYLTSWIVGHTDRFRAACSERAVNNLLALEWTSDLSTAFRSEVGVGHLDDPGEYLRMSPITYVRDITTPMLILHSEDDLRCPISQAEELFVALRTLGREVELYRFPAEGHELSRSGSPVHRRQRAEIILEWFTRHLKP